MANPTGKGGQKAGEPGRNPNGRPPGYQSFIDRAKYLLDQHTIKSIKEFTSDESKFDDLSVYDGMIMRRIVEAVSKDGKASMDSLLDRLLGKPAQYIETKNDTTIKHKPVSNTTEWLEETLGKRPAKSPEKPVSH